MSQWVDACRSLEPLGSGAGLWSVVAIAAGGPAGPNGAKDVFDFAFMRASLAEDAGRCTLPGNETGGRGTEDGGQHADFWISGLVCYGSEDQL